MRLVMSSKSSSWQVLLLALSTFCIALSSAVSGQEPLKVVEDGRGYNPGEPIPVSCLNRTMYVHGFQHES
jgi:hypothetical protein